MLTTADTSTVKEVEEVPRLLSRVVTRSKTPAISHPLKKTPLPSGNPFPRLPLENRKRIEKRSPFPLPP